MRDTIARDADAFQQGGHGLSRHGWVVALSEDHVQTLLPHLVVPLVKQACPESERQTRDDAISGFGITTRTNAFASADDAVPIVIVQSGTQLEEPRYPQFFFDVIYGANPIHTIAKQDLQMPDIREAFRGKPAVPRIQFDRALRHPRPPRRGTPPDAHHRCQHAPPQPFPYSRL